MSAPPAPARPGRYRAPIAVTFTVVAAVLLLGASGIFPGFRFFPPHSAPAPGLTEQGAAMEAQATTASVSGGPWTLIGAVGNDTTTGAPFTGNMSRQLWPWTLRCPAEGGSNFSYSLPAEPTAYSTGRAGAWVLSYYSTTGYGAALGVVVVGSNVSVLGTVTGPNCDLEDPILVSYAGAIDSPAAASAVDATPNGSAFHSEHAEANATYLLTPAWVSIEEWTPFWIVVYSACGPAAPGGPEALIAYVNADTGNVTAIAVGPTFCGMQSDQFG